MRAALEASDLPPERLGLEITESILIKESGSPRSTLEALREIGVKVLIDDFGTGYSSLARLKRFPLDVIKIDRSFVAGVGAEDEDTAIVAAIVEIARSLGLQVVAEGVEGEVQLERLRELGCHAVQGYLFSGPLHGDAFAAFLADEEPDAAGRRRGAVSPAATPRADVADMRRYRGDRQDSSSLGGVAERADIARRARRPRAPLRAASQDSRPRRARDGGATRVRCVSRAAASTGGARRNERARAGLDARRRRAGVRRRRRVACTPRSASA